MRGLSDWIVGGAAVVIGLVGLMLAARAVDSGFYAFGLSLFVFAVVFASSRLKAWFDARRRGGGGPEA